jgi:cell wall-associated NlpC family hydrolase
LPELRDLIGIPFLQNGRNPAIGLDCWGLCREVLKRFGLDVPDFPQAVYDAIEIDARFSGETRTGRWEKIDAPVPGCVVAMAIDPDLPQAITHLGVYIGAGRVLHTINKLNSSLFRTDDRFWGRKIRGYYRWAN